MACYTDTVTIIFYEDICSHAIGSNFLVFHFVLTLSGRAIQYSVVEEVNL